MLLNSSLERQPSDRCLTTGNVYPVLEIAEFPCARYRSITEIIVHFAVEKHVDNGQKPLSFRHFIMGNFFDEIASLVDKIKSNFQQLKQCHFLSSRMYNNIEYLVDVIKRYDIHHKDQTRVIFVILLRVKLRFEYISRRPYHSHVCACLACVLRHLFNFISF